MSESAAVENMGEKGEERRRSGCGAARGCREYLSLRRVRAASLVRGRRGGSGGPRCGGVDTLPGQRW